MTSQPQAPSDLPTWKEIPVLIGLETGRVTQRKPECCGEEKNRNKEKHTGEINNKK